MTRNDRDGLDALILLKLTANKDPESNCIDKAGVSRTSSFSKGKHPHSFESCAKKPLTMLCKTFEAQREDGCGASLDCFQRNAVSIGCVRFSIVSVHHRIDGVVIARGPCLIGWAPQTML